MDGEITGSGLLLTAAGLAALHRAWRAPRRDFRWILAGWTALAAALGTGAGTAVTDRSVALGLLVLSLSAYLLIAATMDRHAGGRSAARARPRPPLPAGQRRGIPWRGLGRIMLAGPLAALFGLSIGILVVRHGVGADADRLVAAGLLAPLAWAGTMAWSLAEPRLARVGLALTAAILTSAAVCLAPVGA